MALNNNRVVMADITSPKKKKNYEAKEYYDTRPSQTVHQQSGGVATKTPTSSVATRPTYATTAPAKPSYTAPVTPAAPVYTPPAPYVSPYANSTFSYSAAKPTYSFNGVMPTYSFNEQAPGAFAWDREAPGAFSYDKEAPAEFSWDREAPEYSSRYDEQIRSMVDDILNRPQFEYNYAEDPLYQQYAESYGRSGKTAMENTLAQVSARTGGMASSYAGTAAQNAYNEYMNRLNDKIPELYQIAYSRYADEGNNMRNNLGIVQGLEDSDYARFVNQLNQYNADRGFALDTYNTALNRYNTDRNFEYGKYADEVDRYNTDRNFAYGQYADEVARYNANRDFAFNQYVNSLNQYNTDRSFAQNQYLAALDQYNADRSFDYNKWLDDLERKEAAARAAYNSSLPKGSGSAVAASSGAKTSNSSSSAKSTKGQTKAAASAPAKSQTPAKISAKTAPKVSQNRFTDLAGVLASQGINSYSTAYEFLVDNGYSPEMADEVANVYATLLR